ncbi:MAG: hypothetical protein ACP5PA_02940 [Elusimicrobiales bacterium]
MWLRRFSLILLLLSIAAAMFFFYRSAGEISDSVSLSTYSHTSQNQLKEKITYDRWQQLTSRLRYI